MIERLVTENGINIILDTINDISTCSIGVFIGTGSKDEYDNEAGISHVLEHMIFKGTDKRNYFEISEEVDYIGASINAHTSKEATVYHISTLSDYVLEATDILFDIVTNSTFDEKELAKEKDVIIEEIKMYEDIPDDLVFEYNYRNSIKGNLGKNIIGTVESVKSFSRENVITYFDERYAKDNLVIVISGKFDRKIILKNIEKYFSKLKENKIEKYEVIPFEFIAGNDTYNKDIKQVNICISHEGSSYIGDLKYYYDIISGVMGGSMSSRLFQKIREENGLAYSTYMHHQCYREGGIMTTYIGTSKENYEKAIELALNEFKIVSLEGVNQKELEKSKNKYLSQIAFAMENPKARMSILGNYYLRNSKIFDVEKTKFDISNIKLDNINKFVKDKFSKENITILGNI